MSLFSDLWSGLFKGPKVTNLEPTVLSWPAWILYEIKDWFWYLTSPNASPDYPLSWVGKTMSWLTVFALAAGGWFLVKKLKLIKGGR